MGNKHCDACEREVEDLRWTRITNEHTKRVISADLCESCRFLFNVTSSRVATLLRWSVG